MAELGGKNAEYVELRQQVVALQAGILCGTQTLNGLKSMGSCPI